MSRAYKPIKAGSPSKGETLGGVEGNLFLIPIVGGIAGFLLLLLLLVMPGTSGWPIWTKYMAGLVPLIVPTAYLFAFFVHKPPNYHADFWAQLISGANFNVGNDLAKARVHPLEKIKKR